MVKVRARALFSSEPVSPVPLRSPWGWALDGLHFAVRPAPYPDRHGWDRALLTALASVLALHLALASAAAVVIGAWDASAGFLPAPRPDETTLTERAFHALLLAPVLEEALWRGWLSGRAAALRFAALGFAAAGCFAAGLWVDPAWARPLTFAGIALALIGFARWLATREHACTVPLWFTRHFRWAVWGGAIAFALIHLGNYQPLTSPLGVLVIVPQAIGGLLLAYTRTRLGLGAAIAHHAAYNGALMLAGWAAF
ncbi:MAG: CPBP family glutamic-type intramembrane protease [Porphyrobacter sp.]|jgi:hypothetical protein|nr:CPBP family glutamic-type intramembrane protease [Porphyrobacter sp.]